MFVCTSVCVQNGFCVKGSLHILTYPSISVFPCLIHLHLLSFFQTSSISLTCHIFAMSFSHTSFSQSFLSSFRQRHVDVMASARTAATLQRLRGVARVNGPEGLRSALQDLSVKDVRELAQAVGLRVRTDGNVTWLPGGELRTALLEHLAPQGAAAPEEVAAFVLFCVLCFLFLVSFHIEGVLRVGVRHGRALQFKYKFPHTTWVRLFTQATRHPVPGRTWCATGAAGAVARCGSQQRARGARSRVAGFPARGCA